VRNTLSLLPLFITVLLLPLFSRATEADCELKAAFNSYLILLAQKPRLSVLRKIVDFSSYQLTAEAEWNEDDGMYSGLLKSDELSKEYVKLKADHYLLLSAWIDSRIIEISQYHEVCASDRSAGELILEATTADGAVKYTVVPFSWLDGKWRRSFSLISGYSEMLDEDAVNILTVSPNNALDQPP